MLHEVYCTCGLWGGIPGPHTDWCKTGYYDDERRTWTITLDRYERDNLLWLLRVALEIPSAYMNTGDWNGQIPPMLSHPGQTYGEAGTLGGDDRPNQSIAGLKRRWQERDQAIVDDLTIHELQELMMKKIMSK